MKYFLYIFFLALQTVNVIQSNINKRRIFQILSEVKMEQRLNKIFAEVGDDFDVNLLPILIECSFESMMAKFKHDCFQHNAHMNYLKVSPVLKKSINILCNKMDTVFMTMDQNSEIPDTIQYVVTHREAIQLREIVMTLNVLLNCILDVQQQCMIYVEVSFVNRFLCDNIFRILDFQRLVQLSYICLNFIESIYSDEKQYKSERQLNTLAETCACLSQIQRVQFVFNEANNYFITNESCAYFNRLVSNLYNMVHENLASEWFLEKNQLKTIRNEHNQIHIDEDGLGSADLLYAKAIFLGVFVESSFDANGQKTASNANQLNSFRENVLSLTIDALRNDSFYFFAVTPREIINSFEWKHSPSNKTINFQSVPIDCLNEIEIVEKFLKR